MEIREHLAVFGGALAAAILASVVPASAQTEAAKIPNLDTASLSLHQVLNLSGDRAVRVAAIESDAAKSLKESQVATGLDHARFEKDLSAIERERDGRLEDLLGPTEFARYRTWQRDGLATALAATMRDKLALSADQAGRVAEIHRKALEELSKIPTDEPLVDRQADERSIEKTRKNELASVLTHDQMKAYEASRAALLDEARAALLARAG